MHVTLHPGRDKAVKRRHPWIMSGAIQSVSEDTTDGGLVRVASASGETLGFGHYAERSQIRVRMIAFGDRAPPADLLASRIAKAIVRRSADALLVGTNALRLVNAEGDDLPGLVVDRFDRVLVVKLQTEGMALRRAEIAEALEARAGCDAAIERSDDAKGAVSVLFGAAPSGPIWIEERGRRYSADLTAGQKTGFYLDQRDARDLCERMARGRSVLDLYAHSGGFAVAAQRGGASGVVLVETSEDALALAEKNLAANEPRVPARLVRKDVHTFLREERDTYDLIVVDPPPLAKHKKDVDRAARAHKDSLLYALQRANADAIVCAFSCSHHVGPDLFKKIVFGASIDAKRPLQILRELGHPPDHPVSIDHPEGHYLSGLVLRAM